MEELIDKAINGDSNAYLTLINLVLSDLYKIARAKLNNIEDVDDAIGETILKSYKHLRKLKHKEYFKTWIIRILINECNLIYKNNNKQFRILNIIKSKHNNSENTINNIEDSIDFKTILNNLKYDERIIIIMYYLNEYTTGEISKILNKNVNTVKSILLRSREKIKKIYEKYYNISNDKY